MKHRTPQWRKSSRSGEANTTCVEVADLGAHTLGIRDSKDPHASHLSLRTHELADLLERVKSGELDL